MLVLFILFQWILSLSCYSGEGNCFRRTNMTGCPNCSQNYPFSSSDTLSFRWWSIKMSNSCSHSYFPFPKFIFSPGHRDRARVINYVTQNPGHRK
jgi:hypothetical protein